MATQIFYPISDILSSGAVNELGNLAPLYSKIDEGISTPNDADYIIFSGDIGNLDRFADVGYDITSSTVIPDKITVRIRAGLTYPQSPGTAYYANYFLTNESESVILGSTNFLISGIINDYTFEHLVNGNNINYNILKMQHSDNGFGRPDIPVNVYTVYAGEIEFSGTTRASSGTTLFIHGAESVPTGCTLFTKGHLTLASGCDLYINSDTHGDLPLYISGPQVYSASSGVPLFIRTLYSESGAPNNSIPLYIRSFIESSGELPLYLAAPLSGVYNAEMPLYIQNTYYSGTNTIPLVIRTQFSESGETTNQSTLHTISTVNSSGDTPLYIQGPDSAYVSGIWPLFVAGPTVYEATKNANLFVANNFGTMSGNTTLYVANSTSTSSSGEWTFYISGGGTDSRSGVLPLYISNFGSSSGNIPLVITGGVEQAYLPLVIIGKTFEGINSGIPLFISSTSNSGVTKYAPLFINSDGRSDTLPLFLKSDLDDESSDSMVLYLHNDTSATKELSLYVNNLGGSVNNNSRLFVKGTGENNSWYVNNGQLNIYLNGGNEGLTKSTNLYLEAVKVTNSGVALFAEGSTMSSSGISLVIPSTVEDSSKLMSLYNHGF